MEKSEIVLGDSEVVEALVNLYQKSEYRLERIEDFKRVFTCLPGKCFYIVLKAINDLTKIKAFGLILDIFDTKIKQNNSSFGKKKILFNAFRTCYVADKSGVDFLPKEIVSKFNNPKIVKSEDFEAVGSELAQILKREVMLIYSNDMNISNIYNDFNFSLFTPNK